MRAEQQEGSVFSVPVPLAFGGPQAVPPALQNGRRSGGEARASSWKFSSFCGLRLGAFQSLREKSRATQVPASAVGVIRVHSVRERFPWARRRPFDFTAGPGEKEYREQRKRLRRFRSFSVERSAASSSWLAYEQDDAHGDGEPPGFAFGDLGARLQEEEVRHLPLGANCRVFFSTHQQPLT